ncbi:MAG: hypothetical protein H6642_07700 [Caldilineaceae bacterium]|nr:hypothetical protein [Caldilineaceae bacterium]
MRAQILQISMLGPLWVTVDGHSAAFRTDAERVLLAYLAVHQGIPQRRDTLAALLSPDRSDKDALTYLRNRLTRLRRALDDDKATPARIEADRKQIALRAGDDIEIDAIRFEELLTTVATHTHRQLAGCPSCLAGLRKAVNLIRGEFLTGLNFPSDTWETWLTAQREYYRRQAVDAMTLLQDAHCARGEWEAALGVAQRQLAVEPWLEAAHRTVMTAHHRQGDRNAALAQYEQCMLVLGEELGVEPGEETQQLRREIFDGVSTAPADAGVSHNLPLQINRFFGRESEQAYLLQRLVDPSCRLITIVGAGGMGKTRLAVETAEQAKENFPDGVWFVSLETVRDDAEAIKIAVGEAIRPGEAGKPQEEKQIRGEQVIAILRDKRMLLILDNCEGALDEIGFLSSWLKRAPEIAIVATSREPLNLAAESVMTLGGLPLGSGTSADADPGAAVALFAQQGRMARADFVVTEDNLAEVRQICGLVDGSPLGIALAAAWVRRRSLRQISESISRSLDFLTTRLRDADPRHRSMRAVFETSWQLLTADEQAALAALSVFPASFTAEAATSIAGILPDDLDLLCEKSLLQQQHEAERYGMHALVRQFAAEKLGKAGPDVEQAFVAYFYELARDNRDRYATLRPEWRNFSAAITKAHAQKIWPTVLDFVQILDEPRFRQVRFQEMREGLTQALDAARALDDKAAEAGMQLRLGEIEIELNEYEAAMGHLDAALKNFMGLEEALGIARVKYLLGRIHNEQAEDESALALFAESLRIFEEENNPLGVAQNLNLMAICHVKLYRDFPTAYAYLTRSIALQRPLPRSSSYVETLRNLARVENRMDADAEAERHLTEAFQVSLQLNDLGEYAAVLYERLLLCKEHGQYNEAMTFGYECLDNFQKLGSLRWEALVKTQLGLLHQISEERARGAELLTEGLQIFCELGDRYEQAYSYYYLSRLYAELNENDKSREAKECARRLNIGLADPQLTALLRR